MAPKKKRSKAKLVDETDNATANDELLTRQNVGSDSDMHDAPNDTAPPKAPAANRSSWSWRSKASPVAQIARESISVAQGATSEASESERPPNSVSKSARGSSRKSIPLAAEATKVHATSDSPKPKSAREAEASVNAEADSGGQSKEVTVEEAQLPPDPTTDAKSITNADRSSWFGWWSRPDGYASDGESRKSKRQKLDPSAMEASGPPLSGSPEDNSVGIGITNARNFEGIASVTTPDAGKALSQPAATTRSWFGLWSSTQNEKATVVAPAADVQMTEAPEVTLPTEPAKVHEVVAASVPQRAGERKVTEPPPKASGWAFWSSDKPKDAAATPGGTQKQVGELAVADTPSQSQPEAAQFNELSETPKSKQRRTDGSLKLKRGKAEATTSLSEESSAGLSSPSERSLASTSKAVTPAETPRPPTDLIPSLQKAKKAQSRPNLILPSFRDTFSPVPNAGYIERLTQYLAQSLSLPGSQQSLSSAQHVNISVTPPKIKKAVAIGVHGFFPGALIQRMIGQPTGTSIRFANHAAIAIKTWCQEHQPDIKDVEIEKVALEGEGFIADRVATLWKLLLNWLSHLQNADFVLVACHSQGVPVAVMLVAKLIQLGCLAPTARVGICAMAGINLGPFSEYKSRLFSGSALELFEFCDSSSLISKAYGDGLDLCLRQGVRITFVGSLDDQLVSLESSLHAPLSHPYVARAVFIDGRLHAPNFLTHLVVFALKLRNLGVSDHGLLRELSGPLAGSLVAGEGHSRIYDDADVYQLATEFALETTDVQALRSSATEETNRKSLDARTDGMPATSALASSIRRGSLLGTASTSAGVAPRITPYEPPASNANPNPFYLPWAVRGMLEEEIVRQDPKLKEEVEVLVKEFEAWRPTSKVLKDVRWRLEGVRSMQ